MEKERVLIIAANDMGNSGVPNVYMQIVRNLSDKYIFDIVITRENYFYRNEFLSYGGQIFLIKEKEYKNKLKRIWWRLFGLKKYTNKSLKEILKKYNYSIVHSFKESESWIYLKIAKKMGIKKRIIHINRQKESFKSRLLCFFQDREIKKSIKYSSNNVAVSKVAGESFFGEKPFDIIYNTYDEKKYFFRNPNKSSDELNLLQIGTFLPIKNQLFSLEVLSYIVKNKPNIKMIFIGKKYDIEYYKKFRDKVSEYNLTNNIIIYNPDIDQKEILDSTTFSVVPSIKEGFSLTTIESQACGIHVFASNSIPKEVDAGNVTFLELNPQLWSSKILELFKSTKNTRKKVELEFFSVSNFKNNIQKLYK